ncbi:hypothetical protein AtubIFM55763_003342 [Aspergillus tubingensis]|uniref:Protein kinase domain-containing protein n=1 Tax=Aspergillus tubingensis TaxID=5068 RepID=A0A9W6EPP3_ASPTU|nr:hypothetical protein AtubIFM55763_003342 [Aspergillus tubingensis]GLA87209.1 hypothetical protein AtubIFM56815_001631 [Aspergillus tubingensis]GLB19077.1 hypothetical protein AtubIFM61612_008980 [Aspergillus tubingensis]
MAQSASKTVSIGVSPQAIAKDDMIDFGDFASTEDEEIDVEEYAEPWEKYDPETQNAYYPICLGEILNERYLIEHKLGAGGFSTVWMALDLQENKDIAVKVFPAKQLLKALEALHNAGIVHRDLSESNCLWGMAPLHNLSRTAKYELLTRPLKITIQDIELWKPGELVRPIQVPETLRTEDLYLADFSLAMKVGDSVAQPGEPPLCFCSPERLHGEAPSFACDMWSYMVNFVELYQGGRPFHDGYIGGVLTTITARLGPLPEQWKGSYIYDDCLDSWYDQNRTPDTNKTLASELARYRPDADLAERELVLFIMQKVFIYSPEERLTATQLLADPSFKALMARYGC